jgi:monovalent cation:H+ antiporter-2, CPA2 family
MVVSPALPEIVGVTFIVLVIAVLLRYFRQPFVVAYIIAGIIIGPDILGIAGDYEAISILGEIGVVLLLFFIGMEVSLPKLVSNWRIAILGTLFQVIGSVGFAWLLSLWFGWPLELVVLLGFVISISSTAVVHKILESLNEVHTNVGQNVIGILLVQDMAIIPMLIILGFLGGSPPTGFEIALQITGGILVIGTLAWILIKREINLPFGKTIKGDHELQVFAALLLGFGAAFITSLFGISAAIGAFIGGIVVSSAKETQWIHESLNSFRVVFVALFFVSIGILINLEFLFSNIKIIATLFIGTLVTNTFINSTIIKSLGRSWRESIYSGSLLSQIGEFSFIIGSVGLHGGIITHFEYQMIISVIALTLLASPLWISFTRKFVLKD